MSDKHDKHGKLSDAQVADIVGIMRTPEASVEAKVACIEEMKASIKRQAVLDATVPSIFETVRIAMTSQHSALMTAGFATLAHLIKRLAFQEPKHLINHGLRTLPLLADRLGDQKDRSRALASQCLSDLWKVCPQEVERLIRDTTLVGKNPRTKEAGLRWICRMSKEHGLHIRPFVPRMVDTLEDADGMVRDAAKSTIIDLFSHAAGHAQADLKKRLQQQNVRKSIVTEIVTHLNLPYLSESSLPPQSRPMLSQRVPTQPIPTHDAPNKDAFLKQVAHADAHSTPPSVSSMPSAQSDHDVDHVEPAYVSSYRELDDTFRPMQEYLEGRENEQNWLQREKSILRLRKLTRGNALKDYHNQFLAGLKALLDGILKCVNSLRTTLSTHACALVQELAKAAGSGLDPMVELLLQNLIRLCAGTKKISSQMGNVTVDLVFANASYSVRLLQHVWSACQDKNVQPRTYASGWLETLVKKHAHHRNQLEHSGGLDHVEKCIRKGLSDPNPGVREGMRSTFWVYESHFADRAEAIMSSLDANTKRSLEKHLANPVATKLQQSIGPAATSKPLFSRSVTAAAAAPGRQSLKETIAARKREAAAAAASKGLATRPGSAQSLFSPGAKSSQTGMSSSTTTTTTTATTAKTSSGLASAPMRPARGPRRPELRRPATAEPFASRRLAKAGSPATAVPAGLQRSNLRAAGPWTPPSAIKVVGRSRKIERSASSPTQCDSFGSDGGIAVSSRRDEEMTMVLPRVNQDWALLPSLTESGRTLEEEPVLVRPTDPVDVLATPPRTATISEEVEPEEASAAAATSTAVVTTAPERSPSVELPPQEIESQEARTAGLPTSKLSPTVALPPTEVEPEAVHDASSVSTHESSPGVLPVSKEIELSVARAAAGASTSELSLRTGPTIDGDAPLIDAKLSPAPSAPPLKVYEDPVDSNPDTLTSKAPVPLFVLEELSVNEPVRASTPTASGSTTAEFYEGDQSPTKPSSPRKKKAHPRPRPDTRHHLHVIEKSIDKLWQGPLDATWFEQLHAAVQNGWEIWADKDAYNTVLSGLKDLLMCRPSQSGKSSRRQATQTMQSYMHALAIMRTILDSQTETQPWASRVYCPLFVRLLVFRGQHEPGSTFVDSLDDTIETLVAMVPADDAVTALLGVLDDDDDDDDDDGTADAAQPVVVAHALDLLDASLGRRNSTTPLDPAVMTRIGEVIVRHLQSRDPAVRCAVPAVCTSLYVLTTPHAAFWKALRGIQRDQRAMLCHSLARHEIRVRSDGVAEESFAAVSSAA